MGSFHATHHSSLQVDWLAGSHADVRWRWPVVRWIITTPEYHHWG